MFKFNIREWTSTLKSSVSSTVRSNLWIFLLNALFVSLCQSGCRQFHNLVPNAGKDLSFICNLDFCTKRLSALEKRVLYTWTNFYEIITPPKSLQFWLLLAFAFSPLPILISLISPSSQLVLGHFSLLPILFLPLLSKKSDRELKITNGVGAECCCCSFMVKETNTRSTKEGSFFEKTFWERKPPSIKNR